MKRNDAASILGLTGEVTPDVVKAAFRRAAKKYHPDINPAGAQMMQVINEAFETLKDFAGTLDDESQEEGYPEALNEALQAIINLEGLVIEICGSWVWVTGNTYEHKGALKKAGYRYAPQKQAWHYRPENWKSASRGNTTLAEIREKFGSQKPTKRERDRIAHRGAA